MSKIFNNSYFSFFVADKNSFAVWDSGSTSWMIWLQNRYFIFAWFLLRNCHGILFCFVHALQGRSSIKPKTNQNQKITTLYVINLHVCMSVVSECTIVHKLHTKSMSSLSMNSVNVAAYFCKHEYYKQKKKLELCVCVSLQFVSTSELILE